jgi:hypothetical protein
MPPWSGTGGRRGAETAQQYKNKLIVERKLILEKFNKKYKNLNENQKNLLRQFLNNGSDLKYILTLAKTEATKLSESITSKLDYIHDDVKKIKLIEVVKQLNTFKTLNHVKNNHLTALIIGYELDNQLNSFQNE